MVRLKRKLRQMKRLEAKIRFGGQHVPGNRQLVWNAFFSTKAADEATVKYPLNRLVEMDRQGRKKVFDEYFYRVYYQNYKDRGLTIADVYDPTLLSLMGLSPHAGSAEIKARFRELAKRYHPDHGGDSEKFIELVELRERLAGE